MPPGVPSLHPLAPLLPTRLFQFFRPYLYGMLVSLFTCLTTLLCHFIQIHLSVSINF